MKILESWQGVVLQLQMANLINTRIIAFKSIMVMVWKTDSLELNYQTGFNYWIKNSAAFWSICLKQQHHDIETELNRSGIFDEKRIVQNRKGFQETRMLQYLT